MWIKNVQPKKLQILLMGLMLFAAAGLLNISLYLTSGLSRFFGALLLGLLFFLFYLHTRLIIKTANMTTEKKKPLSLQYKQFIQILSKRELEVIESMLAGNTSYKKLSAALNISVNTVKSHMKHIYRITGVSGITSLSLLFRGYIPKSD